MWELVEEEGDDGGAEVDDNDQISRRTVKIRNCVKYTIPPFYSRLTKEWLDGRRVDSDVVMGVLCFLSFSSSRFLCLRTWPIPLSTTRSDVPALRVDSDRVRLLPHSVVLPLSPYPLPVFTVPTPRRRKTYVWLVSQPLIVADRSGRRDKSLHKRSWVKNYVGPLIFKGYLYYFYYYFWCRY